MSVQGQSDELTAFYQAYRDWLDAGAIYKNTFEFHRGVGLCGNLRLFCFIYGVFGQSQLFLDELEQQFNAADLDKNYPFSSAEIYRLEVERDTAHLNPKRIQWVRDHC